MSINYVSKRKAARRRQQRVATAYKGLLIVEAAVLAASAVELGVSIAEDVKAHRELTAPARAAKKAAKAADKAERKAAKEAEKLAEEYAEAEADAAEAYLKAQAKAAKAKAEAEEAVAKETAAAKALYDIQHKSQTTDQAA